MRIEWGVTPLREYGLFFCRHCVDKVIYYHF